MSKIKTNNLTPRAKGGSVTIGEERSTTYFHKDSDVVIPGYATKDYVDEVASAAPHGNPVFHLNDNKLVRSYTIPEGKNAGTFGELEMESGVDVHIPDGSTWTIVGDKEVGADDSVALSDLVDTDIPMIPQPDAMLWYDEFSGKWKPKTIASLPPGEAGQDGEDGKSAYEIYAETTSDVPVKTVQEWLDSLQGSDGEDGEDGKDSLEVWLEKNPGSTEEDYFIAMKGPKGDQGLSSFEVWLESNPGGTEEEYWDSLEGPQGQPGPGFDYLGNVATEADLPNDPANPNSDGDAYFVEDVKEMFAWGADDQWHSLGQIQGPQGDEGDKGETGDSAYEVWLKSNPGKTEQEFLDSLKGEKGDTGEDGEDGLAQMVGVGSTITLDAGESASVTQNPSLSTQEKIILDFGIPKGADGADGQDGSEGAPGADGESAYETWLAAGNTGSEQDFLDSIVGETGEPGEDGLSAYEIAKSDGFVGTEEEWLASLQGEKGEQGDGIHIKGHVSDESQLPPTADVGDAFGDDNGDLWIYSDDGTWVNFGHVQGPAGADGADGKSAYASALSSGFVGTEAEWVESLKGDDALYTGGDLHIDGQFTAAQPSAGPDAIAIGTTAGAFDQQASSIAIGRSAGHTGQDNESIAIGSLAGYEGQNSESIAIGSMSGHIGQGSGSIAIGVEAGHEEQEESSIAVGQGAGRDNQGGRSVAIGASAGSSGQGDNAIALGATSATTSQGLDSIAIGHLSGSENQGQYSVAIGSSAAEALQGQFAIAIGTGAGRLRQPDNSIAIGADATPSSEKSIQLKAGTTVFDVTPTEVLHNGQPIGGGGDFDNSHTDSSSNVVVGEDALKIPDSHDPDYYRYTRRNIAVGEGAMYEAYGGGNVAIGMYALGSTTSSTRIDGNVVIGSGAGGPLGATPINIREEGPTEPDFSHNTLIGDNAGFAHEDNPLGPDGSFCGGDNNIMIGASATGSAPIVSNEITLGNEANNRLRVPGVGFEVTPDKILHNGQPLPVGYTGGSLNVTGFLTFDRGEIEDAIRIGRYSGRMNQSDDALAIGVSAGEWDQEPDTVAIGGSAGHTRQKENSVAVGQSAGRWQQGANCIAIGAQSADMDQGSNAIAIGYKAAMRSQPSYTIALGNNASPSSVGGIAFQAGENKFDVNSSRVTHNGNPLTRLSDFVESLSAIRNATKDETTLEGLRDSIGNAIGGLIEKFDSEIAEAFEVEKARDERVKQEELELAKEVEPKNV